MRQASNQIVLVIWLSDIQRSGTVTFARPWLFDFAWVWRIVSVPGRVTMRHASLRAWSHLTFRDAVQNRSASDVLASVRVLLTSESCELMVCHLDLSRAKKSRKCMWPTRIDAWP
ncbi:MAG: hypothetical protein OXJ64_12580, partial [Boseongicola sp.]|nr:hypothetical protein [Boseongicola sp.]